MTDDGNVIQHVDLDLDTVEKPDAEKVRPFAFSVGGKRIVMNDPADLDWQDLADIQQPHDFLRYAVSEEDRKHLLKQDIPAWKFGQLMEAYMSHYKLEEKLNQLRRAGRI